MIPTCTGNAKTTLSGTIRDPAGRVPLYNVNVYVPNAALDPIPEGTSCDRCSAQLSGKPIATALTDANGRFVLENVPATQNVPVVIQVGKWRRQITIPTVTACVDNPITDANLTRLPRTKAEGHIPRMALTTGGSDALECLLRKIGIADAEFTTDTGNGRVHLFIGGRPDADSSLGTDRFATTLNGGAVFPNATTLWGNATKMRGYDIVLLSCEGSQYADVKMPFYGNMKGYGDSGGRIFASHLHFNWLWKGPAPWPMTAVYTGGSKEENDPPDPATATVDTTFPKGAALADWLVAVGATPTRGQIQLYDSAHSVAQTTPPTQRWIYLPTNPNDSVTPNRTSTQYMTFNTPVEAAADAQCGRVVHTDIHVKAAPGGAGRKQGQVGSRRQRHAVPQRLHVGHLERAGKGARVPVLRSVGVRAARHRPPGAAARATARFAVDAAGRDAGAAAGAATAAAATAAADSVASSRGRWLRRLALSPSLPRKRGERARRSRRAQAGFALAGAHAERVWESRPRVRHLGSQLAQHVVQDAAVLVVGDLLRRVDADDGADVLDSCRRRRWRARPARARPRTRPAAAPAGRRSRTVSSPVSPSDAAVSPAVNSQRHDAHADQVAAVDALVALGDHEAHAEQARPLRRPVARRAAAVFLARQDHQRHALRRVLLARVEDRHRRAVGQVARDAALGARREQVLEAHVGERAAHHHLVVAAAGAVAVEVLHVDAVGDQVLARPGRPS